MERNDIFKWFAAMTGMLVWALVVVPHILPPVNSTTAVTAAFLGVEILAILVVVYIGEKIATELRKRYGEVKDGNAE